VLAGLPGCEADSGFERITGNTMGTYYAMSARCPQVAGLRAAVTRELELVNAQMSTYDSNSTLSRFNSAPADVWFPVEPAVVDVIEAALEISRSSGGAFDVTVGPLVNLWGFGAGSAPGGLREPPSDASVAAARERVGYRWLETREVSPALLKRRNLYVDLSAIAKGHGVDRVAGVLDRADCPDYMVDIGGEVRVKGTSPRGGSWRIGIEVPDPDTLGGVQRIVMLEGLAVATSGDYRNYLDLGETRVSHTIDPRTGHPVDHTLASVTVIHESAMWADGFATALNVLGPDEAQAYAVSEQLSTLLLIRTPSGYEERYTGQMNNLLVDR
jgi:thiamine biosynthesis lipoprotein